MEETKRLISQDEEVLEDVILEDPAIHNSHSRNVAPAILLKKHIAQYSRPSINIARRVILFILPSFIASYWTNPVQTSDSRKLRPTAFLDGVPGLAAWAVFNSHIADTYLHHAKASWGQDGDNRSPFQLPIIRLCFKGDFAVALFFVISGFALSITPIMIMRKSPLDGASAMSKMSSAVFRRTIRLMIPSWTSTLLVFILIRLNYFGALEASMPNIEELIPKGLVKLRKWPSRDPSIIIQFFSLMRADADMLRIFDVPKDDLAATAYNGVLWTMKVEYQCSLVLYLTHAALFPMRKRHRVACTVGLIIFGLSLHAIDAPLFWSGYLIAEFSRLSPQEEQPVASRKNSSFIGFMSWLAFGFGSWCGSLPAWKPENIPYFAWMDEITLDKFGKPSRVWSAVGAVLVIWSIRNVPLLLRIYCSRPIHYLGKISFSLYVVHFWLVTGVGTLIMYNIWSLTGKESIFMTCLGFVIGYALIFGLVVWVADLFWRCIDIPSVALAKRVEALLFQAA